MEWYHSTSLCDPPVARWPPIALPSLSMPRWDFVVRTLHPLATFQWSLVWTIPSHTVTIMISLKDRKKKKKQNCPREFRSLRYFPDWCIHTVPCLSSKVYGARCRALHASWWPWFGGETFGGYPWKWHQMDRYLTVVILRYHQKSLKHVKRLTYCCWRCKSILVDTIW